MTILILALTMALAMALAAFYELAAEGSDSKRRVRQTTRARRNTDRS